MWLDSMLVYSEVFETPGQRGRGKNVKRRASNARRLTFAHPNPIKDGSPDDTPHEKSKIFPAGAPICPVLFCPKAFLFGCIYEQLDRVSPSTTILFRRRNYEHSERDVLRPDVHSFEVYLSKTALFRRWNYAPLTLVAIRAYSSPCAALRRSARLSRGCSSSRRENAETFASLFVPTELSRSSLIFTPRELKRTRAPHRRYSDCYTKCQSRHSSARPA